MPGTRSKPQEAKFDFSVVDGIIRDARAHNLRLVLLWFASWKNGLSSYPPDWVKKDFDRFPRAQVAGGKSIELLSTFSDANRDADARAFAALMRHVKDGGRQQHTVIMIQVENEVGMQGDSRDRSPAANKAYAAPVPKELMDYLCAHKDTLIPEFRQVWQAAGLKTSGTWEEVFGKNLAADEIFEAWSFARYVGGVAAAGKAEYPIPMYVNAALPRTASIADAVGKPHEFGKAGSHFAIGGPMADVLDVWRAAAPAIDILSPDAYNDYEAWCAKYDRSGNPLFIPESRGGTEGAVRLIYAIGRHNAIGYSPMGIDRPETPDKDLTASYDAIAQLAPLIAEHQGDGTMSAVLLRGPDDPPQKIQVGNYTLEGGFYRMPKMFGVPPPPEPPPPAAAIIHCGGARRVLCGWQRRDHPVFPEHAGASACGTRPGGRRHVCRGPLGSGTPSERGRQRRRELPDAGPFGMLLASGDQEHPALHAVPVSVRGRRGTQAPPFCRRCPGARHLMFWGLARRSDALHAALRARGGVWALHRHVAISPQKGSFVQRSLKCETPDAASPGVTVRKKRRLSGAGRRAMVEATKRRWEAFSKGAARSGL